MTEQPLYKLKDDRWPLLDAPEKLKDFFAACVPRKGPGVMARAMASEMR